MMESHPNPEPDAIPEHVDEHHAADVFPDAPSLAEAHEAFHLEVRKEEEA